MFLHMREVTMPQPGPFDVQHGPGPSNSQDVFTAFQPTILFLLSTLDPCAPQADSCPYIRCMLPLLVGRWTSPLSSLLDLVSSVTTQVRLQLKALLNLVLFLIPPLPSHPFIPMSVSVSLGLSITPASYGPYCVRLGLRLL